MSFTVNDAAKFDKVIQKLTSKLPKGEITSENISGVKAYIYTKEMMKLYFGIKNSVLIITQGKELFETALAADMKSGFVSHMSDSVLRDDFIGDNSLFYFKVDEAIDAAKNFGAMGKNITPDKLEIIRKFDYLLVSSRIMKDSMIGQILVKTKFRGPFFISLKDIINSEKMKKGRKKKPDKIQ